MDRTEIVAGVCAELYKTELAVDAAIAQATTMLQTMLSARISADVSPVAFSESQTKAIEALAALSGAREVMVECHNTLLKDHRRMGWGTYSVGPVNKPDDPERPFERVLREVA